MDYIVTNGRSESYPARHYGGYYSGGSVMTFCESADLLAPSASVVSMPNLPVSVLSEAQFPPRLSFLEFMFTGVVMTSCPASRSRRCARTTSKMGRDAGDSSRPVTIRGTSRTWMHGSTPIMRKGGTWSSPFMERRRGHQQGPPKWELIGPEPGHPG